MRARDFDYDDIYDEDDCRRHNRCEPTQTHVHEMLGSVKLAEYGNNRHNHRFAYVTSEVIPITEGNCKRSHKHAFMVNTDFFDHYHEVAGETGPAIDVGNGKHVHFAKGRTTVDDDHCHEFQFSTLIDSPLTPVNT